MRRLLRQAWAWTAASLLAADAGPAPATLSRESDLVVVRLAPEAERRLGLKLAAVERRVVPAVRMFPGVVVRTLSSGKGIAPILGGTMEELQRVADQQIQADDRVRQAEVQAGVARITFQRAEKLLGSESGSVRLVDESRAALGLAEAALATARAQREILGASVMHGGTDAVGWVRVAVTAGEAASLDSEASAAGGPIGAKSMSIRMRRVEGPRTANPSANTIDWYFELPPGAGLRPGERLAVEIPLRGAGAPMAVVPSNAVLRDIHGGEWVYERKGTNAYARRRVAVVRVSGKDAVLDIGPPDGAAVVTEGSAELFGTEFVTGK